MESKVFGFTDVDVLNDKDMPAVDYRLSGGLSYGDISQLLQILLGTGKAVGMDIAIFNPKLDSDGSIARRLVSSLASGLASH
ncbi:putative arginase/agmatinase/formiminoglutamase [Candidatus Nitrososphaera gargensis Ga9.2]|uniref:Putative arginase/agmatinase/formiminoglutamase n=1 Tax=Nitrososphaera gargensis (strain Ga9.2) TaxID=1237085 RepID=K0IN58_NITGG|nr:arginase family protein [Candidatus Nitrososphaera gargensis]AFU58799.1 putative arginase/agmatinase/formiminoglutamase [Candidatus Nitrososphaera gargensis Ga9.2]